MNVQRSLKKKKNPTEQTNKKNKKKNMKKYKPLSSFRTLSLSAVFAKTLGGRSRCSQRG